MPCRQSSQCRTRRRVLGGDEEVVMLVQQGAVEGDQGLPLAVVEFVGRVVRGVQEVVDYFDALARP